MEAYAQALTYAIPGFVGLIIIEAIAARIMGKNINRAMDTISSLSSGMTNTLKSMLGLTVVIVSYGWMVDKLAVFEISSPIWLYVLAFIGVDFASYWSHRFNHELNVMWNRHIVHHSSEEFNLSCALRQSISGFFGVYFFLYIPMAIIGIPAQVVAVVAPLHLFAQFWYHTRLIGRMGWLEHILVTPSHHRVHHAINDEYIDKNYAAIFIVWDKWFGTFQEELPDVPAVYGTKKPVETWNPILINFMHIWQLAKDAWRTQSWWDKIRLWFMPTGWRPEDVKRKYPVSVVKDPYARPKYEPESSSFLKAWSWFQLVFHNLLMYHMLVYIADFQFIDIVGYSAFLGLSIFAYTTLMDRHHWAVWAEGVKAVVGLGLIYKMGSWFMLDQVFTGATAFILAYLFASMSLTLYFTYGENKLKESLA